jgi:hypothetical protein
MTLQLNLPKDVEQRLLAQVRAGRHATLEDAVLEKLSQSDDPDLLAITRMSPSEIRADLDDAWSDRTGAVDGDEFFARLASKSAAREAQGK